jgi:regulator of RNase E activity RraB
MAKKTLAKKNGKNGKTKKLYKEMKGKKMDKRTKGKKMSCKKMNKKSFKGNFAKRVTRRVMNLFGKRRMIRGGNEVEDEDGFAGEDEDGFAGEDEDGFTDFTHDGIKHLIDEQGKEFDKQIENAKVELKNNPDAFDEEKTNYLNNEQAIETKKKAYIKKILNTQKDDGMTLLMEVASKGDVDAVNLILENGADVNITDDDGNSALSHAIYSDSNKKQIIEILLKKGADPDVLIHIIYYYEHNKENDNDINTEELKEIINLLLEKGADPNSPISHIDELLTDEKFKEDAFLMDIKGLLEK